MQGLIDFWIAREATFAFVHYWAVSACLLRLVVRVEYFQMNRDNL
jgi:hypothetical protein